MSQTRTESHRFYISLIEANDEASMSAVDSIKKQERTLNTPSTGDPILTPAILNKEVTNYHFDFPISRPPTVSVASNI